MLAIPQERIEEFMREEPKLKEFRHYFDVLRTREGHVRSPEVEAVLATVSDPLDLFRGTHAILADAEIEYGTVKTSDGELEVAAGTMETLLHDPDINVRKAAWEQYADGFLRFKKTFANLTHRRGEARRVQCAHPQLQHGGRGSTPPGQYPQGRVRQYARHGKAQAARSGNRYWSVKRRILGLDKLHAYDVFAPISKVRPGDNLRRRGGHHLQGHGSAGRRVCAADAEGSCQEQRWVDVYPNQGKRSRRLLQRLRTARTRSS